MTHRKTAKKINMVMQCHDLYHSGSRDVIVNVTIWFPDSDFL